MYPDNDACYFLCKGVETVKEIELGSRYYSCSWLDGSYVTHIHEAFYKNEALFSETKIVTSVYSQSFDGL
jgi:starch synthase